MANDEPKEIIERSWSATKWASVHGLQKGPKQVLFGEIASDALGPETIQEVENVDLYMGLDLCRGIDSGEAV